MSELSAERTRLAQLWEEYMRHEFQTCSTEDTLATMVEDAYVVIATSFALNLDSAFDAGYIDSAAHFFSRIRSLWSYPRVEQVSS